MGGIGPQGTSMLNKLGFKAMGDMSDAELRELISTDRTRRVATRVAGRINRIAKDRTPGGKARTVRIAPVLTLESVGFAPALIIKLRASGKSDADIINQMREKGLL